MGNTARAEETLRKLPPDVFGTPRAIAGYHWILGDLDAMADSLGKAIDQRDPGALVIIRLYGKDLRNTPHWARLMRKLNLPV